MNDDRDRLIVPDKTWFTVFSETSSVQCMVIVVNSLSSRDGHLCKIVFFLVLWNPSVAINCAFIKVSIWKVIKYIMPFPVLKQGHVKIHTPYPLYVNRLVYIYNILKKGNGQICIFFSPYFKSHWIFQKDPFFTLLKYGSGLQSHLPKCTSGPNKVVFNVSAKKMVLVPKDRRVP